MDTIKDRNGMDLTEAEDTKKLLLLLLLLQSCLTLCDTIDGSPPGSPVLGVLQARTLEWVALILGKDNSPPENSSTFMPQYPFVNCNCRLVMNIKV